MNNRNSMVNELFEMEREKIPVFMRMTPRKKNVLKVLFISFVIIELLIICWFPRDYGAVVTDYGTLDDGTIVVNRMIPSGYIAAIIIGLLPFIPLLLYCLFVYLLEKTAYSNANRMAIDMAEDRRLLTREKDMELIRTLNKDEAVGLIRKESEDPSEELSLEEEIDSFFRR